MTDEDKRHKGMALFKQLTQGQESAAATRTQQVNALLRLSIQSHQDGAGDQRTLLECQLLALPNIAEQVVAGSRMTA